MKIKAKGITLVESAMFILVFGIALTGLFSVLLIGKEEIAALLNVRQRSRVALTSETVYPHDWINLRWSQNNPCYWYTPFWGVHGNNLVALNPLATRFGAAVPTRVCASYYYGGTRVFAIPCNDGVYEVYYEGGIFWGTIEVSGGGRAIKVRIPVNVRNKTVHLVYSVNWPYVEQGQ